MTWEQRAACTGLPTNWFYQANTPRIVRECCQQCPVTNECLEAALIEDTQSNNRYGRAYGYRAGMRPATRVNIAKQRRNETA